MTRRKLLRLLGAYFSGRRRQFTVAVMAATVVILADASQPLFIEAAVDRGVGGGRPDLLLPLVLGLILVSATKSIAISIRKRLAGVTSIGTEARLRAQLYEHLQALDVPYHEQMPTGQLMSRASSDLQAIRDFLSLIPISIGTVLFILVVSFLLFSRDVNLAIVALAGLPFLAVGGARLTRKLHPVVWNTQQHLAELTAVAEETVTGIRVVKAFGRERLQTERLSKPAGQVLDQATKAIRLRALLQPVFELFPAISMALVLWYGGHRVVSGDLTTGQFIAFFIYMYRLAWPIRLLGWLAAEGQRAITAAGRIFDVLDTAPGIADRPGAQPLSIPAGEIRFEHITCRLGDKKPVLDGVDLVVPPGESVALVGPTGCGKSTMLRLVLRFLEPSAGRITIDGSDIRTVTLESLRNQIGTVFEETFLFSDSISSNVAFARPDSTEDEIVAAAALAQAHGFINDLPDGYDTVVGEQGYTLSGGQRQRIAIARAILMDPKILLLDDATSAVDPEVESEIRRGLAEAMRDRTTLIVARRPGSAALAHRVIYMEGGRILETGSHEDLWERLPSYRETLAGTPGPLAAVRDGQRVVG